MKPFDLRHSPIEGVNLIEAGAGTGKTFTIAGIFLRLIAEVGMSIDQILVVTYTNAATEELKSRIRNRLLDAKSSLADSPDEVLAAIMHKKPHEDTRFLIERRIKDALFNFDRAAIFTIHGFCRRILQHHAFETGHLFHAELVDNTQDLLSAIADDWWRLYIAKAPLELAAYAAQKVKGPAAIAELLQFTRFPKVEWVPQPVKTSLRSIGSWRRYARQVYEQWPDQREQVIKRLLCPSLNATWYGNCENIASAATSGRLARVTQMAAAMDCWDGQYPLFDEFERFTIRFLRKATKKKHIPLTHPFFELCQQAFDSYQGLETELAAYLRYLKVRLLSQAAAKLKGQKDKLNSLAFDDLLGLVHRALCSRGCHRLIQSIQERYRAALVDEFQDTDPQQYSIFYKLFGHAPQVLFMIGDPKQAIYSFRGADLFSYVQAKTNAGTCHTLSRNWRAEPALIQAVNTIFAGHVQPFGLDAVDFSPALPARPNNIDGGAPFTLWFLTPSQEDAVSKPLNKKDATQRIVGAVVQEIVKLLNNPQETICPQDIAVLTRTHHQAQLIKNALARCRVPAVLHSAGSVFDTPEAQALTLILQAVANPTVGTYLRTAMATDLLGADAEALCRWMEPTSIEWQHRSQAFQGYQRIWSRHGFYRMFNGLLAGEGIRTRLLNFADGERRLTNLLHLAELLHQASQSHQLGPEGVIRWLNARRQDLSGGEETEKLRLESDARAVRIVTLHKSKGLEFEVVFCPFTWSGVRAQSEAAIYHDPANHDQLTLAIGPDVAPHAQQQSQKEDLCENIRLLYVALTRAKRRCYVIWGRISKTEISAPAFVFHGRSLNLEKEGIGSLQALMSRLTDAEMVADLQKIADEAAGAIDVAPLPESGAAAYRPPSGLNRLNPPRVFRGRLDNSWRIASYSSISAGAVDLHHEDAERDRDHGRGDEPVHTGCESLFGFPKGARTGLFFHRILEEWQMNNPDPEYRSAFIRDNLRSHGFDEGWAGVIDDLLVRLAALAMPSPAGDVFLGGISSENVVKEMAFYFPLSKVSAGRLKGVFSKHSPGQFGMFKPFLDRLAFPTLQGFMKGFIDMVFCHSGRYYLVDWKSNYLGGSYKDYDPERLSQVMASEYYFLQYHIYTVALDAWLRRQLPCYDYNCHFGGIYYVFLRGVCDSHSTTGIYYSLPEQELVLALRSLLLGQSDNCPKS